MKIKVSAGQIEAWSTGDADPFTSDLYKALFDASEQVNRKGEARVELTVIVVPDEAGD